MRLTYFANKQQIRAISFFINNILKFKYRLIFTGDFCDFCDFKIFFYDKIFLFQTGKLQYLQLINLILLFVQYTEKKLLPSF